MSTLKIPRYILLSICAVFITTWSYLKNLDQSLHLFQLMVSGNLKKCLFGLEQAPTYFQRLVNEVLSGFTFAFGYLDDILVFSPDMENTFETSENSI